MIEKKVVQPTDYRHRIQKQYRALKVENDSKSRDFEQTGNRIRDLQQELADTRKAQKSAGVY